MTLNHRYVSSESSFLEDGIVFVRFDGINPFYAMTGERSALPSKLQPVRHFFYNHTSQRWLIRSIRTEETPSKTENTQSHRRPKRKTRCMTAWVHENKSNEIHSTSTCLRSVCALLLWPAVVPHTQSVVCYIMNMLMRTAERRRHRSFLIRYLNHRHEVHAQTHSNSLEHEWWTIARSYIPHECVCVLEFRGVCCFNLAEAHRTSEDIALVTFRQSTCSKPKLAFFANENYWHFLVFLVVFFRFQF